MKTKLSSIGVRVAKDTRGRLQDTADQAGLDLSDIVRMCIDRQLPELRKTLGCDLKGSARARAS